MNNKTASKRPIKGTTLADCLVFTRKTNITEYGLEAANIILNTIRDLKLTGRVEFLAADVFATGQYLVCVCFEPAKRSSISKFEDFWKPLRDTVQKHCVINGNLELEYWHCESGEVGRFRQELLCGETISFIDGTPLMVPEEDNRTSWISVAIREGGLLDKPTPTPTTAAA